MENVIFFSDTASLNTIVCECNNFNIGTVMQFKRSFASCTKWAQIESFALINTSVFLLQLSFGCNPAFYFNMGKKLERHISFSCTCSCRYRKHPNNDNNICALESSAFFQQHFHGWFTVLSYNSYLKKFEWTPLLLTLTKPWFIKETQIVLHSVDECASFSLRLKLNCYSLISFFSRF